MFDVEIDLVFDWLSRGYYFYKLIMDNVREVKKMIYFKRIFFNIYLYNEVFFMILFICLLDKVFLVDKGCLLWFVVFKL